ncbi:MAG: hypothetical protein ACXWLR_08990, partial [Myxococcales bacterium]
FATAGDPEAPDPDQSGLQCPPDASFIGQYSFALTANHDAGECIAADAGPDAGPLVLTLDDAGTRGATLCVGTAGDGGPQLQLLVPNKGGARKSDLLDDGGFHFASDPVVAQGTACGCDVNDLESLDGYLLTAAPFALLPDGGLPPITGLVGKLVDNLSSAGTGCVCNLPCTVSYSIQGAPF